MADIAIFHSVLGLRPGILDAARRLTEAGHEVLVVDQYDGEVFDDYDDAMAFSKSLGHAELMARATAAVAHLPDGFVVAGFSQGGTAAEFIATSRRVSGALLFGGAVSLAWFDAPWPSGVPAQVHTMLDDPWREQEEIDAFAVSVTAAGGTVEIFDYPGAGHLYTDASLPKEYDEEAAELTWDRVLAFCAR